MVQPVYTRRKKTLNIPYGGFNQIEYDMNICVNTMKNRVMYFNDNNKWRRYKIILFLTIYYEKDVALKKPSSEIKKKICSNILNSK